MIREENLVTILRFYAQETVDPMADYYASCTLLWESPTTVWIKGLSGNFSRQALRALVKHLYSKGVTKVKSFRSSGTIPFATKVDGNYREVDLEDARQRLEKFLA